MSHEQKSNQEAKKKPQMTLMEKRAAKKSKKEDKGFLAKDAPVRKPPPAAKDKRG